MNQVYMVSDIVYLASAEAQRPSGQNGTGQRPGNREKSRYSGVCTGSSWASIVSQFSSVFCFKSVLSLKLAGGYTIALVSPTRAQLPQPRGYGYPVYAEPDRELDRGSANHIPQTRQNYHLFSVMH